LRGGIGADVILGSLNRRKEKGLKGKKKKEKI
jgi:hypothetical protein